MPFDDTPKMPYHGNHNGKRPDSWTGTNQRNYKDPKRRADMARRERAPLPYTNQPRELPENLLVGRNPIREALRAGRPMEKLLAMKGDLSSSAREIIRMARDAGVVVQEVDKSRLDQVYPNHQGLLAYVSSAEYASVDDIFACAGERGEDPFIVVLDGVTDPHNLGAIIRSADCAGAHGVIIPERRSAGLNPACVKAAAGAVEYMRVARVTNLPRTLDELKEKGVWLYASDMDGESVYEADKSGPAAIVIGAEGEGVSRLVLEKCDKTLSIPMRGHVGSLNASVAAGIMLFEFARARR